MRNIRHAATADGHSFAASTIGAINNGLDEGLTMFAQRRLSEGGPYLILDARNEKVREDGVIQPRAVPLAGRGSARCCGWSCQPGESNQLRRFLLALGGAHHGW